MLRSTLTGDLIGALRALFLGLDGWRDRDRREFVGQARPLVQGAQRAMAAATAAQIAALATAALSRPVAPPAVPGATRGYLREGATLDEVYGRPFVSVYTALAASQAADDPSGRLQRAVAAGEHRLEQVAEMDMQQVHAVAASEAMRRLPRGARPTAWQRVLVGEKNCALCVVASTQRYWIEKLNPIHPGCNCGIEPFYGDAEQVIDPERLEAVHAAVAALTGRRDSGARAPDYRELLVSQMTQEHGEVGPMLANPRHRFRNKDQLPS